MRKSDIIKKEKTDIIQLTRQYNQAIQSAEWAIKYAKHNIKIVDDANQFLHTKLNEFNEEFESRIRKCFRVFLLINFNYNEDIFDKLIAFSLEKNILVTNSFVKNQKEFMDKIVNYEFFKRNIKTKVDRLMFTSMGKKNPLDQIYKLVSDAFLYFVKTDLYKDTYKKLEEVVFEHVFKRKTINFDFELLFQNVYERFQKWHFQRTLPSFGNDSCLISQLSDNKTGKDKYSMINQVFSERNFSESASVYSFKQLFDN